MRNYKKWFILYKDWITPIRKLNNTEVGILFKSVLNFVNAEPVFLENEKILHIYNGIISQIEFEWSKYNPKNEKFHWNYKGGITTENKAIRNSCEMKFWRDSVFNRDNFTCQNCFLFGGVLNAHHVKEFAKFPNERFNINNGLTLCKKCHVKIHSKKEMEGDNV